MGRFRTCIPKSLFLAESAKASGVTQSVLSFFEREPHRADTLDFHPFIDAMLTLCRDHRRDESGVALLRQFTEVFAQIRPPSRGVSDETDPSAIE